MLPTKQQLSTTEAYYFRRILEDDIIVGMYDQVIYRPRLRDIERFGTDMPTECGAASKIEIT